MKSHWYRITLPNDRAFLDLELYLFEIFKKINTYHKEYDAAKLGDYGKVEVFTDRIALSIYIYAKRADYLGELRRYTRKHNFNLESCIKPSNKLEQIIAFE